MARRNTSRRSASVTGNNLHSVWSDLWLWPPTTKHVDHQNSIRECINTCVVFWVGYHHLRWHEGRSVGSLCHVTNLQRSKINYL